MQAAHDLNNPHEATDEPARTVDWRGVAWYLLLAFAISWAIFFLKFAGVPFLLRASIGMFGPAIACVLVRLLRREGFADAGLQLKGRELASTRGTWRLYILAYVVPLLAGFLLGVLFQVQYWDLPGHYQEFAHLLATQMRTPCNPTARCDIPSSFSVIALEGYGSRLLIVLFVRFILSLYPSGENIKRRIFYASGG